MCYIFITQAEWGQRHDLGDEEAGTGERQRLGIIGSLLVNWLKFLSLATKVDIEKILFCSKVRLLDKPFVKSPTRCLVDVAC